MFTCNKILDFFIDSLVASTSKVWGSILKERSLRLRCNKGLFYSTIESNQLEDPRQQWREQQEMMLKEYLVTAQDDLQVTLSPVHTCQNTSNNLCIAGSRKWMSYIIDCCHFSVTLMIS